MSSSEAPVDPHQKMTNLEQKHAALELRVDKVEAEHAQLKKEYAKLQRQFAQMNAYLRKLSQSAHMINPEHYQRINELTPLQTAICLLTVTGMSSADISRRLGCAEGTTRQTLRRKSKAWQCENRTEFEEALRELFARFDDKHFFEATGYPKDWAQKYGNVPVSEDPYSFLYNTQEGTPSQKTETAAEATV
ncbi:helix-turn-helix transcriptional regulator [Ferrimonas marina]|nr:helix-turn-helix transcriptional regulator [Ferrimonas marina]